MTRHLAETVLKQVPGWQGATLQELAGGLTNRTWLVEKAGNRAVLKIDDEVRGAPHGSRVEEAAIQASAAVTGLAGDVLYADDVTLMAEYVEGTVWEPAVLEQGDNIERIAAALRRLHALPLSGRRFDATVAARRYATRIDSRHEMRLAQCLQIVESSRQPALLRCCHNDLVAENIIATPGIMFLDWEYACDNDPLFDLATLIEHHQLSGEVARRLLGTYLDDDAEDAQDRLAEQQLLYRALYWLWLAARPDTSSNELEEAGSRIQS